MWNRYGSNKTKIFSDLQGHVGQLHKSYLILISIKFKDTFIILLNSSKDDTSGDYQKILLKLIGENYVPVINNIVQNNTSERKNSNTSVSNSSNYA